MKELYQLFALVWAISAILFIGLTLIIGTHISPFAIVISATFTAVFSVVYALSQESKQLFKN
jgi:hypothetical protein